MQADNPQTCANNFVFFLYYSTTNYPEQSGWIGLGPQTSGNPPTIVQALRE
jgi:hypothetical protein